MSPVLQPQSASDLAARYRDCVAQGKFKDDEAQRAVIAHLQQLSDALQVKPGLFGRLFKKETTPRSVYLWGAVGRGKSLLMDMFYAAAPGAKRRVHFLAFMQEVHAIMHTLRASPSQEGLLKEAAGEIIRRSGTLICLDELEVTDVADAMILSKLFTALLMRGVVFVMTSNRAPEDLYTKGLQREQFMMFVDLVYRRMDVLELTSAQDYRMQQIRAMQTVYLWPVNASAEAQLQASFRDLTHASAPHASVIEVNGRKLHVPVSYGGIAFFTFDELCGTPLGAADYLAIARRFHTVFITTIPVLTEAKRNEARRFVMLIDTLYDYRVKLVCTAEAPPEKLYPNGDGVFEFARTISRLAEMQSESYLSAPHISS